MLLQRFAFFVSNSIIVHNQFSFKELLSKKIKKSKITVIPHGNYLPFVNELNYEPHGEILELLFFGQIKGVKGLDVLLKAIARVVEFNQKIHLTIAGRPLGIDQNYYEKMIKELNISQFVSTNFQYISNEDMENYFKACDLVVLPYKRIYQSGVLLLSMSYGRVSLCSDLEPFADIIEDGKTGYLFQSENVESLKEKILFIAKNKTNLTGIRNNALTILRSKFDWTVIGKQTKSVYEKS